jgi:adenylate cyclase
MTQYRRMEWDQAIARFKESLKIERVPDGKTTPSEVFINRCEEYRENPPVPPGEKWDGVYRMTKK